MKISKDRFQNMFVSLQNCLEKKKNMNLAGNSSQTPSFKVSRKTGIALGCFVVNLGYFKRRKNLAFHIFSPEFGE